jgi:tripartite-type tricarboxylate transporter receptor subunit TctC
MRHDPSRHLHRFAPSLLALSLLATASPSLAQAYPSSMIRIVCSGASGTPPDIISRIVANEVAQSEGWRILVEDKPGAMQTIGAAEVLKQPADGYSVLSVSLPAAVAPFLLSNVDFRLDRDFIPVVKLATAYHVLVVHPAIPANSLPELAALLKKSPDKLTFSSGGFGTPAHLAGELFKLQAGVRSTHVPYQALPQAIGDLINGTNQYQFITPLPVLDLIATGKLRALAVTAPSRMAALPEVSTVGEQGFPDLIVQDFIGLLVKRGTPDDIVMRLNETVNRALAKPNVREAFAKMAADPAGGSPAGFAGFLQSQLAYWGKIIADARIKMHE